MIKPKNTIQSFAKRKKFYVKNNFASLSRDFYVYAGFILAIIISSSLWSAIQLLNSQKTSLQDQLTTQSQLIDVRLSNYLNHISHIAEDKGHKIALKKNDLKNIAYLFKRNFFFPVTKSGLKRKAFVWPHFSWIDQGGNILVKSEIGVLPNPIKSRNSKHIYQSTINSWQLILSDPYYDSHEDKIFIDTALGVFDFDSEEYIGSIATKFNLAKLNEFLKKDLKDGAKFLILNEEFKIIIESDNVKINEDDFFANKLANISSQSDYLLAEGQIKYRGNIYKIYKKSSDYPFVILTGYDSDFFNKEFIANISERFIAIFGSTFFVALILYFQRQRIIKPINNLAKMTKKLGQDDGDFEIDNCDKKNEVKYSSEIYELHQGILLTKSLIDNEKENNLKLIDLNNKLEHQNSLAKKSTKSREKFLSETRQNIIEDSIRRISQDVITILDCEENKIFMTKQISIDLHKKILGDCSKILSYVSGNFNFTCANVQKVITEASEMAYYEASINNIEVILDISNDIEDIYVDERSIKHVVIALINYAMEDKKRNENNSFVKIAVQSLTKDNKKFLEILMEDNGHGISEEIRTSFQQTAEKEKKSHNNTSLSLHSIRSILSSHKSTLEIKNTMGKGSVVTIQIPYIYKESDNEKNLEIEQS
ncbi:MAG: hypothetical protein ACJAS6_001379, partial [Rickettsiales bacterium]